MQFINRISHVIARIILIKCNQKKKLKTILLNSSDNFIVHNMIFSDRSVKFDTCERKNFNKNKVYIESLWDRISSTISCTTLHCK